MSVDIEEWMIADGLTQLHYVTDPAQGATRLNVGALRKLGLQIGWDRRRSRSSLCRMGSRRPEAKEASCSLASTIKKCAGET